MSELQEIIRLEIAAAGSISFARFMELALYHPTLGYYERNQRQIGRSGDFYTSVSVGKLFGQLLGFQFARWIEGLRASRRQIVEAGAHDGRLALDILTYLRAHRPALMRAIEYWVIEPSARWRKKQKETLLKFAPHVRWFDSVESLPASGARGIIFANEFLDALPLNRLFWDAT